MWWCCLPGMIRFEEPKARQGELGLIGDLKSFEWPVRGWNIVV